VDASLTVAGSPLAAMVVLPPDFHFLDKFLLFFVFCFRILYSVPFVVVLAPARRQAPDIGWIVVEWVDGLLGGLCG